MSILIGCSCQWRQCLALRSCSGCNFVWILYRKVSKVEGKDQPFQKIVQLPVSGILDWQLSILFDFNVVKLWEINPLTTQTKLKAHKLSNVNFHIRELRDCHNRQLERRQHHGTGASQDIDTKLPLWKTYLQASSLLHLGMKCPNSNAKNPQDGRNMSHSCNWSTKNNCAALSMNTQNIIQVGIFIFFLASAISHD